MNKVGILLSGGIDSISLAYWKKPNVAITIDYGQAPAQKEIAISSIIAQELKIEHYVLRVNCSSLGSGDLINDKPVEIAPSPEWWPYRNQLLVTLACMKGVGLGLTKLMLASVKTDGYHRDGTPEFYHLLSSLMEFQEGQIKIESPCTDLSSVDLVKISGIPKELLFWAHSCHTSNYACTRCRGCNKYAQTMEQLNYVL